MAIAAQLRIIGNGNTDHSFKCSSAHLRYSNITHYSVRGQVTAIRNQDNLCSRAGERSCSLRVFTIHANHKTKFDLTLGSFNFSDIKSISAIAGTFRSVEVTDMYLAVVKNRAAIRIDQQCRIEWFWICGLQKSGDDIYSIGPCRIPESLNEIAIGAMRSLLPVFNCARFRWIKTRVPIRKHLREYDDMRGGAPGLPNYNGGVTIIQELR